MHEAFGGRCRGLKFALTINGSSMTGMATPDLTKVAVEVSLSREHCWFPADAGSHGRGGVIRTGSGRSSRLTGTARRGRPWSHGPSSEQGPFVLDQRPIDLWPGSRRACAPARRYVGTQGGIAMERKWVRRVVMVGAAAGVLAGCATSEQWAEWRSHNTHFAVWDSRHILPAEQQRRGEPQGVALAHRGGAPGELVGQGHHGEPGSDLPELDLTGREGPCAARAGTPHSC